MDDRVAKVSELLHEAGETHHVVYRITDGADEDWASWYADWLIRLSELPDLLGRTRFGASSSRCWSPWTAGTPRLPRMSGGRASTRESSWPGPGHSP